MTTAVRPLDSLLVMAYIAQRAVKLGIFLNATKLQKLMYICYGVCLAKYDVRICDETPQAWQYGPVFANALRDLRRNGLEHYMYVHTDEVNSTFPEFIKNMIDATLNVFGGFSASQLVDWAHQPTAPWSITSEHGKKLYINIPDQLTIEFFKNNVVKSK